MLRQCGEIHINNIYLMMGSSCNFGCRYCLQSNMMKPCKPHEPNKEVYDCLERLAETLPDYIPKRMIIFWGGEPLMNFDIIKKVVDRFGDKFEYATATNGDLITKEMVQYFNKHDIHVALSHDGINTACTRGKNVLDDPKKYKLLSKIKNLSIESVTSKYNYDYAALFSYISERFGDNVKISVDPLRLTWDMPKDLYDIPLDDYERKLRFLAGQALVDKISMRESRALDLFTPYIDNILERKELEVPRCGAFYSTLDIDCDGRVFVCHNTGLMLGMVTDTRLDLSAKYTKWLNDNMDESCKECPVYSVCLGGCPLEHGYRKKMCGVHQVFYKVCMDLANAFLYSYEPIDWSVDF